MLKIKTVLDLRSAAEASEDKGHNDFARFIRHARNEASAAGGVEMSVEQMPPVGAAAAAAARASAFAARREANRKAGAVDLIADVNVDTDGAGGGDVGGSGGAAAAAADVDLDNITADEVFDALDLNSNGDITKAEFIKGQRWHCAHNRPPYSAALFESPVCGMPRAASSRELWCGSQTPPTSSKSL